ncbi:MAG: hypothetical protein J1F36_06045 [Clostridiales bacterium]|nr:hypothetical protein [Clostridiales bacterium]
MKSIECEFKEHFLEFVLTSFFDKRNESMRTVINYDAIEPAIKDFINHFNSYDFVHKTNHTAMIEQMFVTKELNLQTCDKLGYCKSTYYRYRRQYLQIFEVYLSREIETLKIK